MFQVQFRTRIIWLKEEHTRLFLTYIFLYGCMELNSCCYSRFCVVFGAFSTWLLFSFICDVTDVNILPSRKSTDNWETINRFAVFIFKRFIWMCMSHHSSCLFKNALGKWIAGKNTKNISKQRNFPADIHPNSKLKHFGNVCIVFIDARVEQLKKGSCLVYSTVTCYAFETEEIDSNLS